MFCQQCGKAITENDFFCPQCGTQVKSSQNDAAQSQTNQSTGFSAVSQGYTQNKKLPVLFKWPVICFLYVFFAFFPLPPIILTVLRLRFNKANPQFNNNGFKKTMIFLVAYVAAVLGIAITLTAIDYNKYSETSSAIENKNFDTAIELLNKNYPDRENSSGVGLWFDYYCGLEQYDDAAELYFTLIENKDDILNCKSYLEEINSIKNDLSEENQNKLNDYQDAYTQAEIAYEASLTTTEEVTTEPITEEPKTDNNENINKNKEEQTTESTTTTESIFNKNTKKNIPSFSSPKIGKDMLISSVEYMGKETAIIYANDEVIFYNLKIDKSICTIVNPLFLAQLDALQNDYLADYSSDGSISLIDKYGNKAISLTEGVIVDQVLADKKQYIGRRCIVEEKTAYDELALFSFSGNIETKWLRLPVRYDSLKYVGAGIYLAYDYSIEHSTITKCFIIDVENACINEVEKIQCGEDNENYGTIWLCDALLPHETSYAGGYESSFSVKRMTQFHNNRCIVFLDNQYLLTDRSLFFYVVDRNGTIEQISRQTSANNFKYIDSIDAVVCVTYNSDQIVIKDMYDNTILTFNDNIISNYELYEDYILIEEKVFLSDNTSKRFISIFDYSGEILIDSLLVDDSFNFLANIDCYSMIIDKNLCIFDLSGNIIHKFSKISAKEKTFFGPKTYKYEPRTVLTNDNYYVLWCTKEDDSYEGRYFIGEIEYAKETVSKPSIIDQKTNAKEDTITEESVSIDYSTLEALWGFWIDVNSNWHIELSEKYFSSFSGNGLLTIESCSANEDEITAFLTFIPHSTGETILCKAVLCNNRLTLSRVSLAGETIGDITVLEKSVS